MTTSSGLDGKPEAPNYAGRRTKQRKTIFISHARPDDDELTRWLCGRLSARGYRVWADLKQLLGGDPFWTDIQNTIRFDTIRFIVIVTRTSVTRKGVKDELAEASDISRQINDDRFIIPIKGDDLPWHEFPIQLKQLNGLDFSSDWTKDFSTLLETLERDEVPRDGGDPEVSRVASLLVSSRQQISAQPEDALLNWVAIRRLPSEINYFHTSLSARDLKGMRGLIDLPHVARDRLILSFADLDAVQKAVPRDIEVEHRYTLSLEDFLRGNPKGAPQADRREAQNHLSDILRQALERFLKVQGLARHDHRWFVPSNWRKDNEGRYLKSGGKEGYRVLVGKAKELTWHFGITPSIHLAEPLRIHFIPQVLYSRDGVTPLQDQKQLRRRHCKLWWNDKWRDLLLALLAELFGRDSPTVAMDLGGKAAAELAARLRLVALPASYSDKEAYLPDSEDETGLWYEDAADDEAIV